VPAPHALRTVSAGLALAGGDNVVMSNADSADVV
jgi:hypothetical protein